MATIKPIEGRTIHQIQSGQVIVDLCSVVKELVENSLDAAATSIEVRFRNQGLDSIEVQDNGTGITPENYGTIALKHHTSKLSTYSDLSILQTFGFRGEALSSLCALSHFTITTCLAADAPKGTKLEFETSGKLKDTSVVAAQKGTTVVVENLFRNLPVRRRELERNIKREWNRVVGLLGQYACIQTGVRISATQQTSKGKKTTLFSTKGNRSTRENILNVFGAKTLTALLKLDLTLELEPTSGASQRWTTQDDGESKEVRIVGHISRPAYGEGRQTPDRQMFFVNARPCSLPQVAKAFNEVYKSYNSHQSPFIFANIEIDTHSYDVNVSPDKRTILLHDQTTMLEHLKSSLTKLFDSQDYTVPISQLPVQSQSTNRQLKISTPDVALKSTPDSSQPEDGEDEIERQSSSASIGDHAADDHLEDEQNAQEHSNAESRTPLSQDGGTESLMSKWLGRNTVERDAPGETISKGLHNKAEIKLNKNGRVVELQESEKDAVDCAPHADADLGSSADHSPAIQHRSRQVLDFNRRVAELDSRVAKNTEVASVQTEDPIPVLRTPTRRPIDSVQGVSSASTQPFRSPTTMATITIGDRTIVSSIGSPSHKRPRIEKKSNADTQPSLPSFRSRLTQRFAAPTQNAIHTTEEADESESTDMEASADTEEGEESSGEAENSSVAAESNEYPNIQTSTHISSLPTAGERSDGDYIDEDEKKALDEAKVQELIRAAEENAARPSDENVQRARFLLKRSTKGKDSTLQLMHSVNMTVETIQDRLRSLSQALSLHSTSIKKVTGDDREYDSKTVEEQLTLTINKSDFGKMKIVGQFNLGFILATRSIRPSSFESTDQQDSDDLFIIDQHASDEKYNFERLQAATVVQSQRLVRPKTLDLSAVEEEIVIDNQVTLETNGFVVNVDESGDAPVGQRCELVSLPLSRETTFSLSDLEELISLLSEHPAGSVPRPSKVRKMFAMRACRSSIMIGRTLTQSQMGKVVKHMGEIDKPWNCPHGRPTMRHLFKLGAWDEVAWREGDEVDGERAEFTDWAGYVREKRGLEI